MTPQILLLLSLLVVALALFWWERVSSEVVALGLLLALAFTGLVPADQAFAGFGSDTVIMILGLLILTAALERTGVVEIVGNAVLEKVGDNPDRLLWIVMLASAGIGAFMSNTASTAFFLPMVFAIARKASVNPARLLLPLAFSSIVTSSVTLVSSSTNMVVSGMMTTYALPPIRMFEMAPVGIPIAAVGLIYMYLTRKFVPARRAAADLTDDFGVRPYLSEIVIQPDSPLSGQTLRESNLGEKSGLTVLRIVRAGQKSVSPRANTVLRAGDVLLVEGQTQDILKVKDTAGIEIHADTKLADPNLTSDDTALVEAAILPGSPLLGQTLRRQRFRERFGLQVLGMSHHGVNRVAKLSDAPLQLGDVLLVQGRRRVIARAHENNVFRVLGPIEPLDEIRPRRSHAPVSSAIFVGVLALVSFGVMSLPLGAMFGALLVFATRCITPAEAYARIEWKAIILIACMLSLGVAMEHTGAAKFLAWKFLSVTGTTSPFWLFTTFFVLTVILTQPMSNQAAAIVVLPIAIQTAVSVGLDPRPFAIMVAVAASCSYLTPLEPACLMVYGPGRYRFSDFLKLGAPLTLLIYVVAIIVVPMIWPVK